MTAAERRPHNAARRWQYLPSRIALARAKLAVYERELAGYRAMPTHWRDQRRIQALRQQIARNTARVAEWEAQL